MLLLHIIGIKGLCQIIHVAKGRSDSQHDHNNKPDLCMKLPIQPPANPAAETDRYQDRNTDLRYHRKCLQYIFFLFVHDYNTIFKFFRSPERLHKKSTNAVLLYNKLYKMSTGYFFLITHFNSDLLKKSFTIPRKPVIIICNNLMT